MGEIAVPADKLWGAQTQRSLENFPIGEEKMPADLLRAFGVLKQACAAANRRLGKLDETRYRLIQDACLSIRAGDLADHFPLSVWQTGSGTQTNMNCNEVIAHWGNRQAGEDLLHPNDHVNMSQSSNDTFPSALHIAAATALHERLFPALQEMQLCLRCLEEANQDVVKTGRTHLQDAVPLTFAQEISGWRSMLEHSQGMLTSALDGLYELALGGTAVGTGLNAPRGFDTVAAEEVAKLTDLPFRTAPNKFHALAAKDALVFSHGALKALAADLLKIANDVRWLASGPRCGLGDDTVLGVAASQGNFELNVYMPLMAHNYLQSVRLLADAMASFTRRCLAGLTANREKMAENLHRSLMTVTALTPLVGYENGAKIAKKAYAENISLKEAAVALELFTPAGFDAVFHPEAMV